MAFCLLLVNAKNENLYLSVGNKSKEDEFTESIEDCIEYDILELPKNVTLAISNTQKMGIISPRLKLEDSFIFSSILSDGSVIPLLTPLRLLLGTSVFACQA